ncbi:MAG: alpha/beta fold hydrolase, partial [Candidatus Binatia bacterium]
MQRGFGRVLLVYGAVAAGLLRPALATAVSSTPVTFSVVNTNESMVPCSSDGAAYQISGHLVAPDALPAAVTLYLHGLGYGEWFWNFGAVAGYDFAAGLAADGHASVIIDRLGYGQSALADGNASCLGAQATIAHQIVGQLRDGSYTLDGVAGTTASPNPAFSAVALAGHSAGGAIAEIEAYSFDDVDALIVMSYADQGASPDALAAFARAG